MISSPVKELVANLLISYGNNIKNGNTNVSIDECTNILSCIAHIAMSKEEICDELNLSRSRFDDLVRDGILPKGKKVKHKNNLVWYKDEVLLAIKSR